SCVPSGRQLTTRLNEEIFMRQMRTSRLRQGGYGLARWAWAVGAAAVLVAACGGSDGGAPSPDDPPAPLLKLSTVSSLPDYVTGGDALVQIEVPPGVEGELVVMLDNSDVSRAFTKIGSSTWQGLVSGMVVGKNTLHAQIGEATATLEVTNYPITGPMISGPHEKPFLCTTT